MKGKNLKYLLNKKGEIDINSVDGSLSFKIIGLFLTKDELRSFRKSVVKSRNNVCSIEKEWFRKGLTEEDLHKKFNELQKNIKVNGSIKQTLKNCDNICGKYYR